MFETAELGQEVPKEQYDARVPALREALLLAQDRLQEADFPVVVLLSGVDGAGKGETLQLLNEWLDPRWLASRAFDDPTQDELERPEFWRFWRVLPRRGRIGVFLSAWTSRPLLGRAVHGDEEEHFEAALDEIRAFERTLVNDGALILKFWLHLGRDAQEKRFRQLQADPLQAWRVTERDWRHWELYDRFVEAAERLISRTSTGRSPWHIVEGWDVRFRGLRVGELLLEALERRLASFEARTRARSDAPADAPSPGEPGPSPTPLPRTVLSQLDLSRSLGGKAYREELPRLQRRLNELQRRARAGGVPGVIVLEGWDAAGKGGAIRRMVPALDARRVRVHPIGPPTDEEQGYHYLWRFWRRLPRRGRMAIFDRSWYGRVLVERVEGLTPPEAWRRAFGEINLFEEQLVRHGTALVKLFLHIDPEEQQRRFEKRSRVPYKRYKLTAEDWRNRSRWNEYERAVHAMVERTGTGLAPWVLVPANDKRYARIEVLRRVCEALEARIEA